MSAVALELELINKAYGACISNKDASLRVERGTIHAVVGENGAGKSTLLSIAYGSVRADAGRLRIDGVDVPLATHTPAGAIARHVGMVHQHFMLVPNLSVVENVVLGREPRRGPFLDLPRAAREVSEVAGRVGLTVDPGKRVEELSVGEQQRVEIVKVLWRGAEILLLDEPTAVLTPREVQDLFVVLRGLAAERKTIVIVTHKLDEVVAIADAVTVMRGGKVVADFGRGANPAALARAIVGSTMPETVISRGAGDGAVVLAVARLAAGERCKDVSLTVRAGEIVGIAGVVGNGQSELVLAVCGLLRPISGSISLGGADVTRATPAAHFARGLGHIAEDRHARAVILDFSLAENLLLGRQAEFTRHGLLEAARVEEFARERLAALDVRPGDPAARMGSLSGGNQQKVVVARELSRPGLRLLVAAEPTRGVDIGATAAIHDRLRAARRAGAGVLLVSSELSELRALADRIVVVHRGVIAAEVAPDASDETLGALMTGGHA